MKKNLLLVTAILFCLTVQLMAQCTPDQTITKPLIPDSATGLPHAVVGTPYASTIFLKTPGSAMYQGIPVTIDSLKIMSVTGLPTGFSYVCNTPNSSWPGNSFGCILLTGNPAQGQQNTTSPITVNIRIFGVFMGFATSVDQPNNSYKIIIDAPQGLSDISTNKFSLDQNMPNPFTSETNIDYTVTKNGPVSFKVFNMLGKEVFSTSIRSETGRNTYTFKPVNLGPGIYMYSIGSGSNTLVKRMIIGN